MAARALAPLLCDYDRPRASTGDVLRAWHEHLTAYGPLRWEEAESILSRPMPPRRMPVPAMADWILRCRQARVEAPSLLVRYVYRDYSDEGPPKAAPYSGPP